MESLGARVFYNCVSLENIYIPTGVTNIGEQAFANCGLSEVVLPDSVMDLGSGAFLNCQNLRSLILPTNLPCIRSDFCRYCYALTSLTIPATVTNIGESAFLSCTNLTDLVIPDSVFGIGDYAFADSGITNITIPASTTNLGSLAFGFCAALTGISIDSLNPNYTSVDGVLFNKNQTVLLQCPGARIGSYTLPGSVTRINAGAFEQCNGLTNAVLPVGLLDIGEAAFFLSGLSTITIPSSVQFLGRFSLTANDLRSVYFKGNAPAIVGSTQDGNILFASAIQATFVYRSP